MEVSQSATIGQLAAALAKAQRGIQAAKKDSLNPHFRSKYADLASCWDACREQLTSNGISVVQPIHNEGPYAFLKTVLMHESGEWIASGSYPLKPVKDDPQGLGSAITYARRYSLCAMVGVAPDDDDGEAATGRIAAKQSSPQKYPEPQKSQEPQQASQYQPRPQFQPTGNSWSPSQAQIKRLFALKHKAGWHEQELKQYISAEYGVNSTAGLSREQYDKLCNLLDQAVPFKEAFDSHDTTPTEPSQESDTKGGGYDSRLDEIPF